MAKMVNIERAKIVTQFDHYFNIADDVHKIWPKGDRTNQQTDGFLLYRLFHSFQFEILKDFLIKCIY